MPDVIPRLPSPNDNDLSKIVRLFTSAILELYRKNKLQDMLIAEIKKTSARPAGKFSAEKYIGRHFKFVEYTNPDSLRLYYSSDGIVWPDPEDYLHEYKP